MPSHDLLRFTEGGNSKLPSYVVHFSLPAGHSCPGANLCLSKADPDTGKLTDGKQTKFRCFSATSEAAYAATRIQRWHNFNLLLQAGSVSAMRDLMVRSMPSDFLVMRWHIGGDFFSQTYFDAWMKAAATRPQSRFYAYTKSLSFWVKRLDAIPENVRLVASAGGKHDAMIRQFDLPHAVVVFHPEEAEAQGLKIDHDDSLARDPAVRRFALLLHGQQPKDSPAAAALTRMRQEGVTFGYAESSR